MMGESGGVDARRGHRHRATWVAALVIVGIACLPRVRPVSTAFLFGDETWSVRVLSRSYAELVGLWDDGGAGLALPLLQKASVELFGFSLLAVRLPALLPALATVVLVAMSGSRVVTRSAALFSAALLATSSMHVFYSRFGRSYALVALLAYVYVANLTRILAEQRPSGRRYAAAALAGGLLPWAHILAAPFTVATGAAAIVAAALQSHRQRLIALQATLAVGAGIAVVLYLPAWEAAVVQIARERQRVGLSAPGEPFDSLNVLTVLVGGRAGAYALLVAVPLAVISAFCRHGVVRLPLVVAALAPLPLMYLVAPYGHAFSYARYTMPALPALALLLGEWLANGMRRLHGAADRAVPALAVLLALGLWAAGPGRIVDDGPYANGYLSLVPLPAFDEPFPGMPDVYRRLESGARIIEAPPLPSRARYLYRNYYLQHRRPTLLGILPEEREFPLPGPYVKIDGKADLEKHADYLVIHVGIEDELAAYFQYAQNQTAARTPQLSPFAGRHGFVASEPVPQRGLVDALTARYGPPLVNDGKLLVYRLRPAGGTGQGDQG